MRVVGICGSARIDRNYDGFHLVLLGIGDKPADLIFEILILLDGIIVLAEYHSRAGFLFEKVSKIRA